MSEYHRGRGTKTKEGDPLTPKQVEVLGALRAHQARYGMPPTVRQLSRMFGFAHGSGAVSHLNALVAKGAVRRLQAGSARCYVPITPEDCCPACGQKLPRYRHPIENGGTS